MELTPTFIDFVSASLALLARHLNDFTKALAAEVRILLQEVGQLRDERRQLQLYVPFLQPKPLLSRDY